MNSFDFDTLRIQIREAARSAFGALRAQHPGERFYAMALYTDDGAMTVCPSANSEEAFQRMLLDGDFSDPADVAYARWGTAEWAYEALHAEQFDAPCERLRTHVSTLGGGRAFGAFCSRLHDAMTQALAELDQEGFFGTGADRQALTLFCSISDSDEAEALEDRSAKQLNPPAVFAAFKKRWDASST
ncbi:DUF4303 domain-containing protein [Variovorax sp. RKNM96]|uniref:DUF4303 domain-containing protein n=1 Tax=Variovorax sp. RKNM96 TaxID=2681552 RepID=UPI001981DAA2|nr:DUF4303 domain-containing protein [Variovorax sp. RKNM96]QSI32591.1 DUF4303 domain-containing protein [Variovorax sp. RKNM96]